MVRSQHYLLLLICLWLNILETQPFGMNLIQVAKEDPKSVECAVALLRKYFKSGDSLSGSVLDVTTTAAGSQSHRKFLQTLHESTNYAWSIVMRKPLRKNANDIPSPFMVMHEKPQCYFLILESIDDEDIEDVFKIWKSSLNWNPLAQFVVYVASVEETVEEMTDIMIEVLLMFMNWKIYNVNVISQSEENNFVYGKTVFPYHPDNNCGSRVITTETLDICDYQGSDDEEDEEEDEEEGEDEDADEEEEGAEQEEKVDTKNENEEKVSAQDDVENGDESNTSQENQTDLEEDTADDVKEKDSRTNTGLQVPNDQVNVTNNENSDETINEQSVTEGTVEPNQDVDKPEMHSESQASHIILKHHSARIFKWHLKSKRQDLLADLIKIFKAKEKIQIHSHKELTDEKGKYHNENKLSRCQVKKWFSHAMASKKSLDEMNESKIRSLNSNPQNKQQKHLNAKIQAFDIYGTQETVEVFPNSMATKGNTYPQQKSEAVMYETEDNAQSNLYIEEMYRAKFSDKFPKDLSGCALAAGYRPGEPYIFNEPTDDIDYYTESTQNDTSYNDNDEYDTKSYDDEPEWNDDETDNSVKLRLNGIEYKLLETIGERLHISINIRVGNTNVYQLFQQLIDGDIEIVVGGIDEDPTISQYVSSTVPYHQDDLTWCVTKAKRSHNLFNFIATFEPSAWLFTFLCIHAASFSVRLSMRVLKIKISSLKSFFQTNLRILGIVVSQGVNLPSIPTSLQMNFGTIFYMSLMFGNIYQSFLVSTLTNPKSSYQISLTEDLYLNRLNVMGSVDNVRHLNKDGEVFRYIREHFQMCYNIEECLQRTALDSKLAVAASRQHSFYNPRIPRDQLYCFDRNENIYVYLVTMLMPKKFHLLHKINTVIQNIIESGHMQKWARDLDMRRNIIEQIHQVHEEKFKSLTIAQVVGPFALNGFLLLIATMVFGLECLTYWLVVKRRTRLKIAKYLHRKFV